MYYENWKGGILDIEKGRGFVTGKYYYSGDFNFAAAMNAAIELSTGEFYLKIDADERLLIHQHKNLLKFIENIKPQKEIGGAEFHVISTYLNLYGDTNSCRQKRLNRKGLRYSGKIHEVTDIDAAKNGLKHLNTSFKIDHIGYECDDEKMFDKLERNILGIIKNPEQIFEHEGYKRMFYRDCSVLFNKKYGG
jgi:glycosyltransferase involved in cell wall biosynthesis